MMDGGSLLVVVPLLYIVADGGIRFSGSFVANLTHVPPRKLLGLMARI